MIESVLTSVKICLCGIPENDESFDENLMMYINSAFGTLYQLGIGPEEGYVISDKTDKWSDFITDQRLQVLVKDYVVNYCKIHFAPPESGFVMTSLEQNMDRLEWRLRVFGEQLAEGELNVD